MKTFWESLWREDKGHSLAEYGLILVLISLVAITAMKVLGTSAHSAYSNAPSNTVSAGS